MRARRRWPGRWLAFAGVLACGGGCGGGGSGDAQPTRTGVERATPPRPTPPSVRPATPTTPPPEPAPDTAKLQRLDPSELWDADVGDGAQLHREPLVTHDVHAATPSATQSQREAVVLALLAGGRTPTSLPQRPPPPTIALPQVEVGVPEIEGAVPRDNVRRGVTHQTDQIHACFVTALLEDPTLAGEVVLAFDIEGRDGLGYRTRTKATSDTLPASVGECLIADAISETFPAPADRKTASVEIAIDLRPPASASPPR